MPTSHHPLPGRLLSAVQQRPNDNGHGTTKQTTASNLGVASGYHVRNCVPWPVGQRTGRIFDTGAGLMTFKHWTVSIPLSAICQRMVFVGGGYCCANNQKFTTWPLSMPNAYTAICVRMRLLLERKPAITPSKRAHTGKVAVREINQRWCSYGFAFNCDNGENLRVTFTLECCDREVLHWVASTGGCDRETVQDVMLGAMERRFGSILPTSPVESIARPTGFIRRVSSPEWQGLSLNVQRYAARKATGWQRAS